MRLIDAEILEKKIKEYFKTTIDKTDNVDCVLEYNKQICNIITKEPTAYDVDKVVEKLELIIDNVINHERAEIPEEEVYSLLLYFVQLVKRGGKDE